MILKRKAGRPDQQRTPARFRRFGNPDDVFAQSRPKGLLTTQAEVRAIALAQLDVQPGSVLWDIGAGSGSVAIEAAQLATAGKVYAIEQDVADYHLMVANTQTFGLTNVEAIHGMAPAVFAGLPAPDGIFVGGTGKEVTRLLDGRLRRTPAGRKSGGACRVAGESECDVCGAEGDGLACRGVAREPGPRDGSARDAALRGAQSDVSLVRVEAGEVSRAHIAPGLPGTVRSRRGYGAPIGFIAPLKFATRVTTPRSRASPGLYVRVLLS